MTSNPVPPEPTESAASAPLAGIPVLVVEDDPSSARLLSVLLTTEGSDVRVARTAEEALAILQVFPARLIIVDLVLPSMSGLVLVQTLKRTPSTRGIIAVAVSVVDGLETERMALESGCVAYLRKPLDIQAVVDTLIANVQRTT